MSSLLSHLALAPSPECPEHLCLSPSMLCLREEGNLFISQVIASESREEEKLVVLISEKKESRGLGDRGRTPMNSEAPDGPPTPQLLQHNAQWFLSMSLRLLR